MLERLDIEIDDRTAALASTSILTLAREHGLTAYDAACIELAMRTGASLATRDEAIVYVAGLLGVAVLE